MVYFITYQTSGLKSHDTIDWVEILLVIQIQDCLQNKLY